MSVLSVACCTRKTVDFGAAHRLPPPEELVLAAPAPVTASSDTVTATVMRNVLFHVDDNALLGVRHLRGRMRDLRGQHILLLDDKTTIIELKGTTGVRVKGTDLFIEPLASLPPPKITGRLMSIHIEPGQIIQTFVAADGSGAGVAFGDAGDADAPSPANFIRFRGGFVALGKLFMVNTDLEVIDGDPTDPFEFYLDYYNSQLVAGHHISTKSFGLIAYMPDFGDLGTGKGRVRE